MIFTAYVTAQEVRNISGLTTIDIDDSSLETFISYATAQFNSDVQLKIIRERVGSVDNTRKNLINGDNTIYYVKYFKDYYLGDMNNDGSINSDDIIFYLVAGNGIETTATVSSVDSDDCKITLSSAPSSGNTCYITYMASPIDVNTPHFLVKLAVGQMASALAFTKIDVKKVQNFSIGKTRITTQSQAYNEYYNQYKRTLDLIRVFPLKHSLRESVVDEKVLTKQGY